MGDPKFARWQQATRDAGRAQDGARALMLALTLPSLPTVTR